MANIGLSKEENLFCELYATGDAPFTGNAARCYMEAYPNVSPTKARTLSLQLLSRTDIREYIAELETLALEEVKSMKNFLSANLKAIVEECASSSYKDKKGVSLSPAPLRSVAVNAAKALMEMHPVKEATVNKLNINGGDDSNITFNIIVPGNSNNNTDKGEAECG